MNMEEKILQIPIEDIIPNRFQPRLSFDDQALQELANSIKQHGIIQPLVLRKLGDKYEIIAGERRYKASQMAGLTTVPAVISNIDDDKSAEVALIENIQRKNLTSIEEAKSYKNLLDRGYMTQEQLAEKLGVSQSTIANKLRLLNLADEVQDALLNEKISERHARSLLALKTNEEQVKWLNRIINERLTVRQLDIEIKKLNNSGEEDEDSSIPIVELTPNIDDIKQNALDINPAQGLHDIESMLKPSVPGEKVYNLSNPVDSIETLDIDEDDSKSEEKTTEVTTEEAKPQNKFFNVLEDEVADMNEDSSIDDIFSAQPENNNEEHNSILDNSNNIIEENNNTINDNNTVNTTTLDDDLVNFNNNDVVEDSVVNNSILGNQNEINITPNDNIISVEENPNENSLSENNNEEHNNIFFNFGNSQSENNNLETVENNTIEDNSIIEQTEDVIQPIENDNTIETVQEQKNESIFDPMSMVNTLEPDYEEKKIEEQGLDLKTAINSIRDTKDSLENKGFKINIEEADLGESYNISLTIFK